MVEEETRERSVVLRPKKSKRRHARLIVNKPAKPHLSSVVRQVQRGGQTILLKVGKVTPSLYFRPKTKVAPSFRLWPKAGILPGGTKTEKIGESAASIGLHTAHPALEAWEFLFHNWAHGTQPPSPKEQVRHWLQQEKLRGEEHFRRVLSLGDESGSRTLGELVESELWDEALAIIRRVDHG